jgi:hypothetical protein
MSEVENFVWELGVLPMASSGLDNIVGVKSLRAKDGGEDF